MTTNSIYVLTANNKLGTETEIKDFSKSLDDLFKGDRNPQLLPDLIKVFDDSTENFDVMGRLLTFVESFDKKNYIDAVVHITLSISDKAMEWLELIYLHILNADEYMIYLREVFPSLSADTQNIIRKILLTIADDDIEEQDLGKGNTNYQEVNEKIKLRVQSVLHIT